MAYKSDVITLPALLGKVPGLVGSLPALIKGSRMSKISRSRVPVGLAKGFQQAVRANPGGVALLYEDRRWTYKELNLWANKIAHHFSSNGLVKGDTVAINIENRPELIAVILACAKLGLCAAMLNTSLRGQVLVHSFNLVTPKAAVIGEERIAEIEEIREQLELPEHGFYFVADPEMPDGAGASPAGYEDLITASAASPDHDPDTIERIGLKDPLFYIYTSGTTGLPKAVVFNNGRWWKAYGGFGLAAVRLRQQDRLYCTLPFYHATGMVVCWSSVISAGAGLVLARRFSVSRFWQDIRRHECTAFGYVGELCRYLHEVPPQKDDAQNPVRVIVGNGLRPGLWKAFKKRFGIQRVVEFYASSEGNVAFTNVFGFDNTVGFSPVKYAIVEYDKEQERPLRNRRGFMKRAAKGQAGLLLGEISNKTPFDGYTDRQKTEESIFRDVFRKGDAWFNTGDLMRDIGFRHAQFVDRLGDTFRWKGENVSTTEVEIILDQQPGVLESVVYGVEVPGTNGRAGMAQVRLAVPPEEFDFAELAVGLRRALPSYAVPVFLRINEEAMTTTGTFKHQKNRLKEQGYTPQRGEAVYVLCPGHQGYQRLTAVMKQDIDAGRRRL
ncbi:long-chain-acyl-CoA synthetase [Alcanivorax quisquiliarum]|uniref:Long-chain-acyl-CoA synthetase n=1 Tax=Alcanivorax quisquiliarum TaxID=2933565 RepID=A0ABT0E9L8_9GAMM|nr:long-chain-acyl-CoA synthetase [Alcanivorax quisquiliarum]MCK0538455.1 long-chain-acyl-CoA synthetase [Alcanivorax quisquiliarum]